MGYYLVTLKPSVELARLSPDELKTFKEGLKALETKGSLKAAYSKVSGGLVLILETDHAMLTRELRKHFITDAEVVPLIPLEAELGGYIEYMSKNESKRELFQAKHRVA
jgi:hypothetical protein